MGGYWPSEAAGARAPSGFEVREAIAARCVVASDPLYIGLALAFGLQLHELQGARGGGMVLAVKRLLHQRVLSRPPFCDLPQGPAQLLRQPLGAVHVAAKAILGPLGRQARAQEAGAVELEDPLRERAVGLANHLGADLPVQDLNLLYVMLTRAKKAVHPNAETVEWIKNLDKHRSNREAALSRQLAMQEEQRRALERLRAA